MSQKILMVSSEKTLAHFTSLELQKADFAVDCLDDGQSALRRLSERDYDLILLDMVLSDMSSQVFAEKLSRLKPASVIIVMAEREEALEQLDLIQSYAVSVMVKPFAVEVLRDTIQRIFRGRDFIDQHCSQLQVPTAYRDLRLDVGQHTVYRGDEQLNLTRREYDLLATLMTSGQPLSREQLLERVWKYESVSETNVVDVYIRYLRGKIDVPGQPSYIKTVRGVGYGMRTD